MSNRFLTEWGSRRLKPMLRNMLIALGAVRRPDMAGVLMERHPAEDALPEGALVVVADEGLKKWACFRCPGGCGGKIQLTLSQKRSPHWTATLDWLGRPTLHPSIRQLNACGCHFWMKNGMIEWCADGDMSAKARLGHTKV